jgi:hypothetical protein
MDAIKLYKKIKLIPNFQHHPTKIEPRNIREMHFVILEFYFFLLCSIPLLPLISRYFSINKICGEIEQKKRSTEVIRVKTKGE